MMEAENAIPPRITKRVVRKRSSLAEAIAPVREPTAIKVPIRPKLAGPKPNSCVAMSALNI